MMGFESIIGILVAIIIPKLCDNLTADNDKRYWKTIKIVMICILFLLFANFGTIISYFAKEELVAIYNNVVNTVNFQNIVYLILILVIILLYSHGGQNYCSFRKLKKIIEKFTRQVGDNDSLYIFCGDMDVWGNVEDNQEFKQLLEMQERNKNVEIHIICKHCMDEELISEIIDGIYDEEEIGKEKRMAIAQVERIAFFKTHLKMCHFRFYTDPKDDYSSLRARVISSNGKKKVLIYHESKKEGINLLKKNSYVYEYRKLDRMDDFQLLHYVELGNLKWENCDSGLAKKIENFCIKYCDAKQGNSKMVKKIAFVYAETYEVAHYGRKRKEFPPFGVMYLAAMVRENCIDWRPEIISIDEDNIDIRMEDYAIISFSVISAYTVPLFEKCMRQLKEKKEKCNKAPMCIAGGYQAELEAEEWVKKGYVQLVLRGEGEENILKLLNSDYNKSEVRKSIPGAMCLSKDHGKMVFFQNTKKISCVNLDALPMPARDLLPEDKYIMSDRLAGTKLKMVHILFSRGCSYNCAYCGVRRDGNRVVRYRSIESINNELEYLKNKGIEGFSIIDDCFLTDKEKALEIIKSLNEYNLKWSLAARADQIDEEIVAALKESGCVEIKLGLETGSNELLSKMKKGFTVEKSKAAIKLTKKYGIGVKVFIISGLPGENKNTNEETKDFLKEMGKENIDRISLLRFVPLPGSYIYDHPDEFGIRRDIKNLDRHYYKLYEESANWWANESDFTDRNEIYEDIKDFMLQIWDTI